MNLPPEEQQQILEAYRRGASLLSLAQEFRHGKKLLSQVIAAAGIKRQRTKAAAIAAPIREAPRCVCGGHPVLRVGDSKGKTVPLCPRCAELVNAKVPE